jgi:hypothetical protein
MKRPSISFDKEAIVDFLLRHGEKLLVAVIGLSALGLAWGGVDAVRSKSVSPQQRPEALARQAGDAAMHVDREKTAPASEKWSGAPLATAIDPWRKPPVSEPPPLALLDRPLFEEFAKRTQPDVLPIEDLRAVAGLAVLPFKQPAAEPAAADRPRGRPREPAAADQPFDLAAGQPGAGAGGDQGRGRVAPYVVVTGLIPVSRQAAEYRRRFESVGFQDAKRDAPLWADWTIERTVVGTGPERWAPVDLAEAGRRWQAEWSGVASDKVPDTFLLSAAEDKRNPKTTPPYCGPLPQLLRGSWGVIGLHPWVLEQVRKKPDATQPPASSPAPGSGPGADVFSGEPGGRGPDGQGLPAPGGPEGGAPGVTEFRMFRFIDTSVEPGKAYRYRVRFEVWNPNVNLPVQHLTNAALAKQLKLASPPSNETTAVSVPDPTAVLVGPLRKADMKKMKPGMLELLVLAPSARTGDYALRGLVTEPGGLVNVDEKLNKPGDRRTRGEEIRTDRVLVDVRGRQEDRTEQRSTRPPEPFELLCLRPDGGFEFVSAADAEPVIAEHKATLPVDDAAKGPANKPGQPDAGPSPFGSPF